MTHPNAKLKDILELHYTKRNVADEIREDKPDPLLVARQYINHKYVDEILLLCALLSYGSAKQIVKTLGKINFDILESKDLKSVFYDAKKYKDVFGSLPLYRFQTSRDIAAFMCYLQDIIYQGGVKKLFLQGYDVPSSTLPKVVCGINHVIEYFNNHSFKYSSQGLDFMLGKVASNPKSASPFKRWNMYLRWLVRCDNLDFGLWSEIPKYELLLPLDTHTFKLCQKLELIDSKRYNLHSVIEATNTLMLYDKDDPIKYDFALYRIGQEKDISNLSL